MKAHEEVRNIARKVIGEYLTEIINDKKMNKRQISRDADISPHALYNILKGEKYEMDSLLAILQVLDMRIEIMPKAFEKKFPNHIDN